MSEGEEVEEEEAEESGGRVGIDVEDEAEELAAEAGEEDGGGGDILNDVVGFSGWDWWFREDGDFAEGIVWVWHGKRKMPAFS